MAVDAHVDHGQVVAHDQWFDLFREAAPVDHGARAGVELDERPAVSPDVGDRPSVSTRPGSLGASERGGQATPPSATR
ncbi:hypothetical protein GCM10010149_02310 [Nonomuraea roseoviolacea subsp. roseoviolacea]|uniref:hypothetical protein n=1 Tax=Nonomuraea roseoviolacea TaxID=103837 RepID=UPI0031D0178C